ncbi:hypothetical protein R3W88_000514 [Solanum pinnatisectum]|uniref:DUF4228 domain-containing protein n=1 Tax=Solanum pinnatisectum TaxID=50273 RepID=A0AAV9MHH4_9SOLN|nr:hypothetical protein R3W88_000514 [Solanum pinnatisectum]
MGNFISCGTSPKVMSSRPTRVIFQNGKIQKFNEPIIAAELMLESPNSFLVNSSSLIVGRRFSALSADEELEFGNIYIMFPMKKLNSVITTKDIISIGKPGLENEATTGRSPEKDGVGPLGFPVRQEFRKPLLETIMEEQVISSR